MNQNKPISHVPSCYFINAAIKSTQKDMRRLVDFYSGAKTLDKPTPPRTKADNQRFLGTLQQLRERIETLQKQRDRFYPEK